jgi:hypothetical protein
MANIDLNLVPPTQKSVADRIQLAILHKLADPTLKVSELCYRFNVPESTVYHRLAGRRSKDNYSESQQRLTRIEEECLVAWLDKLLDWGWPAEISQLQAMANHLLHCKNDQRPLHEQWYIDFLERHPQFQTKWSRAYDQRRHDAKNPDIWQHWFRLYQDTIQKYSIFIDSRYNMDEKGFAMGITAAHKIVTRKKDYYKCKGLCR